MNKKDRRAISNLVEAARNAASTLQKTYGVCGLVVANVAVSIAAVEKVLNPPVRFLWHRVFAGSDVGDYLADIGGTQYRIHREGHQWVAKISGTAISYTKPTLAEAKQACVDYGVRNARKPE